MKNLFRDFISYENREYSFKIGKTVASSLTGFLMGVIATNIVWSGAVKYIFQILS